MMLNGRLIYIRFGNGIGNCTIPVLMHRLLYISLMTRLLVQNPSQCRGWRHAGNTQASSKTFCICYIKCRVCLYLWSVSNCAAQLEKDAHTRLWVAGLTQPKQVGVELPRGPLGSCSLFWEWSRKMRTWNSLWWSLGRYFGLAENSSGLHCSWATLYGLSGFAAFVSVPSRRRLRQGAWWYHTSANDSAESRYLKLKLTRLWSYCAGFVYVIYSRGKVLCSFVDWQEVFISYNVPVLIWFSCFYPSMWQWCGILTVSQQSSVGSIKLMWLLVKYWLTIFLGWALTRVVVGKLWFSFVISFHLILMCGVMYMVVIFF